MRPKLALLAVAVVLSTTGPLHAGGSGSVVEAPYRTPAVGAASGGTAKAYYFDCVNQVGCAIIPLKKGARYASLEIKDATGQPVLGSIYLMPGGTPLGDFCGSTDEPIPTLSAVEILVHVVPGSCADGTASVVTTGTVKATLSPRR